MLPDQFVGKFALEGLAIDIELAAGDAGESDLEQGAAGAELIAFAEVLEGLVRGW